MMSISSDANAAIDLIKSKRILIFDFDGVLADSVQVKNKAFAEIYKPFGSNIVKRVVTHLEENEGLSRYDKFKYYHNVFLKQELGESDLNNLSEAFSQIVFDKVIASNAIKNSEKFLEQYCKKENVSVINSATPTNEIIQIINARGIGMFFEEVYGSPSSKVENLIKIKNSFSINYSEAIFFGDAKSDFNAAQDVGIDFIGIGKKIANLLKNIEGQWLAFDDFSALVDLS
jgi:phosphoglycolate phosphatase-like HAD superfamily hydrolase